MSQINEHGAVPGWTRVDQKKHVDGSDSRAQTLRDHSSHWEKHNPNMQPTHINASKQPNVTARFTINSPVSSLRRSPTNPYHGSSTFVVVANQKAKSEPGIWEKPPILVPQRASDAQFGSHQKRRTHIHEQVKQFREEVRNSTKVSRENTRLSKHVSSFEERTSSSWDEKRRTTGKSLENMAAMSTTPLGHYHKHRSMSPTKKSSQSTQGKGSFSHKKTLSLMADGLKVRLWDGNTVLLKPTGNQTLGELLRPYMKNVHKPMECVDSITERVLSWNTRAKDLNRRGVNIREIGSLVTKANTPVTTSTKKLEKRGSASGDNLASLQQWFSYFASADRESKTLADRYEISCLKELPPSSTPSPRGSWNRRKGSMEPKTTSGTESEYIFQTVPDSPRLTRSTSQLDDANSLARLIDYRRRLLTIGDNWEDIVKPDRELTTQEKKKQAAIWEVFVTEINYLNYIRNILNVYMDQFNKIHDNLFLNLEPAQMFNNLVQVYQSNLRLWFGYLHKAYTRVRDSGDLMKADILEPGFMQIPQLFWPYISYCLELPRCQKYIKHANNTNTTFSTFLRWADSNGLEHREPLWDQLAKPFKRVTQYCLMLENIRKYCENQEEINSVSRMVAHISAFVRLIDNQINHLEPREEMDALVDELMFPDYNENPGDEYQYFYDHFRRSSLLEDIELPAPVVLTMPEVRPILDSFVLDQDSWVTSNETSGPPISGLVSPPPVSESTTLGNSLNSQQKFDRGGATRESNQSMFDPHITASRSNSLKQDITTPLIDIQPDSIQVYLCKWSPPKSYNISKLSPNVLDRIRTANMPVGLRRTVPRRLLHKGTLRFRERQGKWTDVTCFILTDQFLITKSYKRENADRYKVYKTPVRLDKLVINKMSENCFVCAVLDDFHMITHLYTFVTGLMHTDEWCSHLRKAKAQYLYMMRPEVLIATAVPPTTNPLLRSTDSAAWSTSEDHGMRDSSTPSPARPATLLSLTKATGKKIAAELSSPSSTISFQGKHNRPQIPFFPNEYSGLIITDNRARPILSPSVFEVASGSQTTVGKPRHHAVKPYSVQPHEDPPGDQLTKTESSETTVSHNTSGTPQASTKTVFANENFATLPRPSTAGSPSHTETNLTISHDFSISSSEPSQRMDESPNRQHRVVRVKSSDTTDSNNLSQSLHNLNGLQFIPTHVISDSGSHKTRILGKTSPPMSKKYDEQDIFTRSCATPTNRSSVRIIRANANSTGTSRL